LLIYLFSKLLERGCAGVRSFNIFKHRVHLVDHLLHVLYICIHLSTQVTVVLLDILLKVIEIFEKD